MTAPLYSIPANAAAAPTAPAATKAGAAGVAAARTVGEGLTQSHVEGVMDEIDLDRDLIGAALRRPPRGTDKSGGGQAAAFVHMTKPLEVARILTELDALLGPPPHAAG